METTACGKVIISGEHAVVYGAPALAVNVPLYLRSRIEKGPNIKVIFNKVGETFTYDHLLETVAFLDQKYELFLNSQLEVNRILTSPWDLVKYVLGKWLETYPNYRGFCLELFLDGFPLGCGLGGSAALITLILKSLSRFFLGEFNPERWFSTAKRAENLQHGKTSGMDLMVSFYEQGYWVKDGLFQPFNCAKDFYLVNTGVPLSSTGECVAAVSRKIQDKLAIFEKITCELYQSINQEDSFFPLIRENHRLLTELGVVPEAIQAFISEIEGVSGVGKISGAGSIRGVKGGMVLVWKKDKELIEEIIERYGYSILCA